MFLNQLGLDLAWSQMGLFLDTEDVRKQTKGQQLNQSEETMSRVTPTSLITSVEFLRGH